MVIHTSNANIGNIIKVANPIKNGNHGLSIVYSLALNKYLLHINTSNSDNINAVIKLKIFSIETVDNFV